MFKPLNRSFLFQIGQTVNVLKGLTKQPQSFVEILKSLLPADV
jgi:hypothetical protein